MYVPGEGAFVRLTFPFSLIGKRTTQPYIRRSEYFVRQLADEHERRRIIQ